MQDDQHGLVFSENLEIHLIELPKFVATLEGLKDPLDVWLYFLRHAERLDPEALPPALDLPIIHRAMEELTMLTQNDLERERYEARLKAHHDYVSFLHEAKHRHEQGLQQGRAQGAAIGRIQVCQRLLKRRETPEEQLLALPLDELFRQAEQLEKELPG